VIPAADIRIAWTDGSWLNPPPATVADGADLLVTAAEGSDLWRTTSYGFVHEDGHALLLPFEPGSAVEVSFRVDYDAQFDQAGVLVWADPQRWVKTGVEFADGVPQLGAVVTDQRSDWSTGAVPDWAGSTVTMRVSRAGDALTIRARREGGAWRMVRLAPWQPDLAARAGPYCCAPTRSGLHVRFTDWRAGPADERLHE
jgi:regulation of enolase protein 1 (concanavalin A-like superfamily)